MLLHGIDLTERRISQISSELRKLGLLGVQRAGFGRSNRYILHVPLSPDGAILENLENRGNPESPDSRPVDAGLNRVPGGECYIKEQKERTIENMGSSFEVFFPAAQKMALLPQAKLNGFKSPDSQGRQIENRKRPEDQWTPGADLFLPRMREAEERLNRLRTETAEAMLPGLEKLRGVV